MRILKLFLIIILIAGLSEIAESQSIDKVNARGTSKTNTTEIAFTVTNPKATTVKVLIPGVGVDEIDVTSEKVQFITIKLLKDINIINLQAFEGDAFLDNTAVTIKYAPDKSDAQAVQRQTTTKPVKDSEAANPQPKPLGSSLLSLSIDGEKETATDKASHTLEIVPNNLPADASKYQIAQRIGYKTSVTVQKITLDNTAGKPISPEKIPIELKSGENQITVSALYDSGKPVENSEATVSITCFACDFTPKRINTRAIVGFEQVGSSSSNSSTYPFVDLFINVPIGGKSEKKPSDGKSVKTPSDEKSVSRPFSLWTDFRFSASSQQNFAALSNISTGLLDSITGTTSSYNNIVQSFNISGGIDYEIIKPSPLHSFFLPGKSALSIIIGGGVTNPLSSDKTVQVFKIPMVNNQVNPDFAKLFKDVDFTGKTTISFVTSERDRFFRRYFGGFRLKNYFYENENTALDQSPAMLDLTVGQDEAITSRLQGLVMKLEGFTPFPVKKYDYIYLFGGVNMRFHRNIATNVPFFLETPSSINLFDSANVVVPIDSTPFTRSNRDTFRFGIGIDLIRLLNKPPVKLTLSNREINPIR